MDSSAPTSGRNYDDKSPAPFMFYRCGQTNKVNKAPDGWHSLTAGATRQVKNVPLPTEGAFGLEAWRFLLDKLQEGKEDEVLNALKMEMKQRQKRERNRIRDAVQEKLDAMDEGCMPPEDESAALPKGAQCLAKTGGLHALDPKRPLTPGDARPVSVVGLQLGLSPLLQAAATPTTSPAGPQSVIVSQQHPLHQPPAQGPDDEDIYSALPRDDDPQSLEAPLIQKADGVKTDHPKPWSSFEVYTIIRNVPKPADNHHKFVQEIEALRASYDLTIGDVEQVMRGVLGESEWLAVRRSAMADGDKNGSSWPNTPTLPFQERDWLALQTTLLIRYPHKINWSAASNVHLRDGEGLYNFWDRCKKTFLLHSGLQWADNMESLINANFVNGLPPSIKILAQQDPCFEDDPPNKLIRRVQIWMEKEKVNAAKETTNGGAFNQGAANQCLKRQSHSGGRDKAKANAKWSQAQQLPPRPTLCHQAEQPPPYCQISFKCHGCGQPGHFRRNCPFAGGKTE
ncbi:uncharacterized protein LOC120514365 [Polypterus senegalus]|uniref:uncharacterized protein LOC120514365 n=1 Tax=Polypterus senegalus TaxID=55291 RepID=UPI001965E0EC|nr:uncharacterized protein LOC120514365 [Polypterus senegalus]XP_039590618.1 uncharacterized protein LOC120514365 [Polypterus senegalus]XP_039590619.1 uncharacterized protein LOC120514365 [Polypterus senegalus]